MTASTKTTIKAFFATGDKPTEAQFIDLIDSYQDYDTTLNTLSSAASGVIVKASAGGFAARTITGTANEISVSAGDGVTNPTISLPTAITLTGKTLTGGTFVSALSITENGVNTLRLTTPTIASDIIVTLPGVTSTLATLAGTETLTNKTISAASNTFNHTPITNSLGADVLLNNTASFFDGPSVAQGSSGTWWVTGTVTLIDTAGTATFQVKLWDGTTLISSTTVNPIGANIVATASLSGYLASPAGNLRISVKDITSTSGKILYNQTGTSKDSVISAIRIG